MGRLRPVIEVSACVEAVPGLCRFQGSPPAMHVGCGCIIIEYRVQACAGCLLVQIGICLLSDMGAGASSQHCAPRSGFRFA